MTINKHLALYLLIKKTPLTIDHVDQFKTLVVIYYKIRIDGSLTRPFSVSQGE